MLRIRTDTIGCVITSLLFMICFYPAAVLEKIGIVQIGLSAVWMFYILVELIWGRKGITFYDVIFVFIVFTVLKSGVSNDSLYEAIRFIGRTLLPIFVVKYILSSNRLNHRKAFLYTLCGYFLVECLINTIWMLLSPSDLTGINSYFLGGDNSAANTYFMSIFMAYLVYEISGNRKALILSIANMLLFTVRLQIASSVTWIAGFIVFAILYLKKDGYKAIKLNILLIIYGIVCVLLLTISITSIAPYIDLFFYGKSVSLSHRMELWRYFLELVKEQPLWGYGPTKLEYRDMIENLAKWKAVGNCHNIVLEIAYRYGLMTLVPVALSIIKCNSQRTVFQKQHVFIGAFVYLVLLHGLSEIGFSVLAFYLPFYFYSDKIIEILQVEQEIS